MLGSRKVPTDWSDKYVKSARRQVMSAVEAGLTPICANSEIIPDVISVCISGESGNAGLQMAKTSAEDMQNSSQLPIVQSMVKSLIAAQDIDNNSKYSNDSTLTLSFLYPYFTLDGINLHCFGIDSVRGKKGFVTRTMWELAGRRAKGGSDVIKTSDLGSGSVQKVNNVYLMKECVQRTIEFICDPQMVQPVACGTHTVKKTNNQRILYPTFVRNFSYDESYNKYKQGCWITCAEDREDESNYLPKALFLFALKALAPKVDSLRNAVDSVFVKCCLHNEILVVALIKMVCLGKPDVETSLITLCKQLHHHLRYTLWSHIEERSACLQHSFQYLCGGERYFSRSDVDENTPDLSPPLYCAECDKLPMLYANIEQAIDMMWHNIRPPGQIGDPILSREPHPLDRNTKKSLHKHKERLKQYTRRGRRG
jgi:hypothetical protein